ncbi:unnamed protein product [Symbiodinium sp. KB8]|nr:unnamed protein product [Symbiodinium sp. KB8]
MHEAYGDSRFCFVPRGKSGWSLRFFEVLFAGCIPVMISDKWELPFEDFLDVTRFVIKWPSTQIGPQLLSYLRSLPDSVVQNYMDEAAALCYWQNGYGAGSLAALVLLPAKGSDAPNVSMLKDVLRDGIEVAIKSNCNNPTASFRFTGDR